MPMWAPARICAIAARVGASVSLSVPDIDRDDLNCRCNLSIAALQVLNAANIHVQGATAGLPTVHGPMPLP